MIKVLERKTSSISSPISFLLNSFLLFFYIYEFNLSVWGLPSFVTSRRIVVFILFALFLVQCVFKKNYVNSNYKVLISFIVFTVACTIYGFLLHTFIGVISGSSFFEYSIRLILFGLLPVFFFVDRFKNLENFFKTLLFVTCVQALIVLFCSFSTAFQARLDHLFGQEHYEVYRGGYFGGLACITASGCIRFSLGLIACVWLFLKKQNILYFLLFIFLGLIDTSIARTGLLFTIIGLFFIYFSLFVQKKKYSPLMVTTTLLFVAFAFVVIVSLFGLSDFLSNRFYRLVNLFAGNGIDEFFTGYFNGDTTSFPAFSAQMLLGTGVVSGISGNGMSVNVDGGYLRTYSAIGLPLTILFYLVLLIIMKSGIAKLGNRDTRIVLVFFAILIFVAEFKEMTILVEYMVCMFFTTLIIQKKDESIDYAKPLHLV